jgi:two-component system, NtrC family, response regulator GlrR
MPPTSPESTRSLVRPRDLRFQKLSVRVEQGPDLGRAGTIESPEFRIGSADDNDLQLTDLGVSRHHCLLRVEPDGHVLSDLESKNGLYLAGHRVGSVHIGKGVTVTVGSTVLNFSVLEEQAREPLSEQDAFGAILGASSAMRRIFAALPRIAESELTVLLEGETGTGKTVIAEAIHRASKRAQGPFCVLDCSAIPPTLIESELFGHVKGAFTGAHQSRAGAFEAARGGTVFLDEVGELPLEMQPKLLRALEERAVKRLGSVDSVRLDVRVLAATNRDLRREVDRGAFRADLFYRLHVVPIRVPPLRERPEDIAVLATHFYAQVAPDQLQGPPAELIGALCAQSWPGNVRELRSAVERSVLMQDVQLWDRIKEPESQPSFAAPVITATAELPFRVAKERAVARWERDYLKSLIGSTGGNLSAAARLARMDRNHLRELLSKHGELRS